MREIITLTGMLLIIPLAAGLSLVVVSVVEEDKKPKQLLTDFIFFPIFLGVVFGLVFAFVLCPCANWFFNFEPTSFDRYGGWVLFFSGVLTSIYFVPSLIAIQKKKKNKTAITVLNFLAGWTFFGYVAALVWALTED